MCGSYLWYMGCTIFLTFSCKKWGTFWQDTKLRTWHSHFLLRPVAINRKWSESQSSTPIYCMAVPCMDSESSGKSSCQPEHVSACFTTNLFITARQVGFQLWTKDVTSCNQQRECHDISFHSSTQYTTKKQLNLSHLKKRLNRVEYANMQRYSDCETSYEEENKKIVARVENELKMWFYTSGVPFTNIKLS